MPELFIIAGCNGAGKTTAAREFLPNVFNTDIFINADNIAAQLNPENPAEASVAAARKMLIEIRERLEHKESFAIETTLATRIYFNIIKQARELNYHIVLYFFYLPSYQMAIERVKLRVTKGGHHIPHEVIDRRYKLGLKYFFEYLGHADEWLLYDNSELFSHKIARGEKPDHLFIYNFELWEQLNQK